MVEPGEAEVGVREQRRLSERSSPKRSGDSRRARLIASLVHYVRNTLSYVNTDPLREELPRGLRDAWAAPTREEARARPARHNDAMRGRKFATLADWLEATAELFGMAHPTAHLGGRKRTTTRARVNWTLETEKPPP
jgi:hypothetical protein